MMAEIRLHKRPRGPSKRSLADMRGGGGVLVQSAVRGRIHVGVRMMRAKSRTTSASTPAHRTEPDVRRTRMVELRDALATGILRRDAMRRFGFAHHQSFNRVIKKCEKTYGITVERDETTGTGDDATYRTIPKVEASIELPLEHALPSVLVLRQFSEQMLGAAGAGSRGFAKQVHASLADDVRSQMAHLADRVSLEFNPTRQGCAHAFSTLVRAIAGSCAVVIDYEHGDELAERVMREAREQGTRGSAVRIASGAAVEVEVHGVFFRRRALYAVVRDATWRSNAAHRRARDGVTHLALRMMRLSRIHDIRPTANPFTPIRGFRVRDFLADAFDIVRKPTERRRTATIRIRPEFGVRIADTTWHHSQQMTVAPDGTHVLKVTVRGFDELRFWIAWMGEGAEIVDPPDWRRKMIQMIDAMRARYRW
ncbi:MAG: WYL domain-containing protein [Phycisphaerales bacterium]|nr:WYL domain-containing protein [Phycisphaerales bacterium]